MTDHTCLIRHVSPHAPTTRTCRVCGCTDNNACVTVDGPCHWYPDRGDLCSACAPACFLCDAGAAGTSDKRNPLCDRHEPHRDLLHQHVVSMNGGYRNGYNEPYRATCACGWTLDRDWVAAPAEAQAAIRKHWQSVIGSPTPDFSAQTGEAKTDKDRHAWFQTRAKEIHEKGATWIRVARGTGDEEGLCLIEGWRLAPTVPPAPHFYMTLAKTP